MSQSSDGPDFSVTVCLHIAWDILSGYPLHWWPDVFDLVSRAAQKRLGNKPLAYCEHRRCLDFGEIRCDAYPESTMQQVSEEDCRECFDEHSEYIEAVHQLSLIPECAA